jgi:hypothetical protein
VFQENIILYESQGEKDKRGRTIDMKKCKFYSDYICNHYGNGLCHYAEKVFGYSLPDSCNHINDFENCTCFEPIEYDKVETAKLHCSEFNVIDKGETK